MSIPCQRIRKGGLSDGREVAGVEIVGSSVGSAPLELYLSVNKALDDLQRSEKR